MFVGSKLLVQVLVMLFASSETHAAKAKQYGINCVDRDPNTSQSGQCFLFPGEVCIGNEHLCIPQAYCFLNTGRCTCLKGLKENKHGLCTLDYGAECLNQPDGWNCDTTKLLTCDSTEGKCVCYNSNETIVEDGTCKLRAHSMCVPDSNFALQCIEKAVCSTKSGYKSLCKCREPLKATKAGLCEHTLNHNATCRLNYSSIGTCDEEEFLECNQNTGRCECKSNSRFNPISKMCSVGVGDACKEVEGSPPCDRSLKCESGICRMKSSKCESDKTSCNGGTRHRHFVGTLCVFLQSLFLCYIKSGWF